MVNYESARKAAQNRDSGGTTESDLYWIDRLATQRPTRLPDVDLFGGSAQPQGAAHRTRDLETAVLTDALGKDREIGSVVLTLWVAYLSRVTGEADVVIGYSDPACATSDPARSHFAPLTVSIEATDTFAALYEKVSDGRRQCAGTGGYSMSLFDRYEELNEARAFWADVLPFAATFADDAADATAVGPCELGLIVGQDEQVVLHHDANLQTVLIDRLLARLREFAAAIAAKPALPIARQPLLPAAERKTVVQEWNATVKNYPYGNGLIGMLEEMAAANPDHPAVIYRGETLSYGEFNRRANRLANHLREKGVRSDDFVCLCLDRSLEMVIAIWAVLKAGGAYVPLNTEDPSQRLAEIIEDADPQVVLTQEQHLEKLPAGPFTTIALAEGDEQFAAESDADPDFEVGRNDLAYMIYTSGSTGKPKGVLIEHEAIYNRVIWMQDEYRLTSEDRVLQKTPYTFDVSVWEFLWPLVVGSSVVVAEPGGHMVPSYLVTLIKEARVTAMHFVPSMLRLFLFAPGLDELPLRMVFCSGEALPYELTQEFLTKTRSELHNLYGPTEAAVDVSSWACLKDASEPRVPIGKPIANIGLYILDEAGQPVPIGVPGELFIGGIGLARGYHARPDLTSERFIDSPLTDSPHRRFYKTGDVARFLPDGNIEYLGRNDHQVKINGIRIELGEIEAVIRSHPLISDAVVVAKQAGGGKMLAAYLVATEVGETVEKSVSDLIAKNLPQHMMPRSFVFLEKMPLTSSGEVDRKLLPDPKV